MNTALISSSSSEPGSPTMGEAILMGCQDANVAMHDYNANKVSEAATLADLVVSTAAIKTVLKLRAIVLNI